jgi:type II secretory pathway pseudopilin PulG
MILDAILHQVLLCNPYVILRDVLIVVALVGFVASFIGPSFGQIFEHTKKAKAKLRAMVPREAQAKIDSLSRRLLEAHDRETVLRKENHELRRLVSAEANWGRNHRADIHTTIRGKS